MDNKQLKDALTDNNFILFTLKSREELKDITEMIDKTINKNRSLINELENKIQEENKVTDREIRQDLITYGMLDDLSAYTSDNDSIVKQLIKYKTINKSRYHKVLNNIRDYKEKGNEIKNINAYISKSFQKEYE